MVKKGMVQQAQQLETRSLKQQLREKEEAQFRDHPSRARRAEPQLGQSQRRIARGCKVGALIQLRESLQMRQNTAEGPNPSGAFQGVPVISKMVNKGSALRLGCCIVAATAPPAAAAVP